MTSLLLSDEDRKLVRRLAVVVEAKTGATSLAAVIRYALRRAVEDFEATQPGRRR